jgi:hypothetical protein
VGGVDAVLGLDPHQVVVGIVGVVAVDAAADLEIAGRHVPAVDEVVAVAPAGRVAGALPGAEHLLAGVGDEHDLALEHPHELVLERVPMAQRRLGARRERHEVDPEAREAERVAQPAFRAVAHARAVRLRIPEPRCSGTSSGSRAGGVGEGIAKYRARLRTVGILASPASGEVARLLRPHRRRS